MVVTATPQSIFSSQSVPASSTVNGPATPVREVEHLVFWVDLDPGSLSGITWRVQLSLDGANWFSMRNCNSEDMLWTFSSAFTGWRVWGNTSGSGDGASTLPILGNLWRVSLGGGFGAGSGTVTASYGAFRPEQHLVVNN